MESETISPVSNGGTTEAQSIGASVVEKHKRKPRSDAGKPRGPRNPFAAKEPEKETPGDATQAALAVIDFGAIKKGVAGFCKVTDAFVTRKTFNTALKVTGDRSFATETARDVSMLPDELELISELTAVICQRHELLGKYAPELLLVGALASYGTRTVVALRKLDDIAQMQLKARGKAPDADKSQAN